MGKYRKKISIIVLVLIMGITNSWAANPYIQPPPGVPHDVATLEALISQHKTMMEVMHDKIDMSLTVLAAQEVNTLEARGWRKYKKLMEEKTGSIYSYLRLAYYATECLKKLQEVYQMQRKLAELATNKEILKKPWALVTFYTTEEQFTRDIKTVVGKMGVITASQTGILHANEEQRFKMVQQLQTSLDHMTYNLGQGIYKMKLWLLPSVNIFDSLDKFLDTKEFDRIAEEIIIQYSKNG